MKKVKMVKVFFLLFCLMGYMISSAQSEYVVTTKGDTIRGKVKYLNFGNEKKVQVANDNKTVYSILETSAFRMDGDEYHTVRYTQGYTYMKVMKRGYLSLYAFQLPDQVSWDGRLLLKREGSSLEVPNIGFKKQLQKFLSDCPAVVDRIKSGEFKKSKIEKMINAYNECIDLNTKNQNIAVQIAKENKDKLGPWNQLETDVKNLNNFEKSKDALEMIQEIKLKIGKGEKVPNFLIEGLKEALKDQSSVQGSLEKALAEIVN